ncbi:dynein heavy chain domain-containing protein 1-like isoform X11 [Mytilus californianus]|uniref:dynein heavy chain domain-containing protein 1-like isoform X11 n=1 Tax=Mytilus californianus TaxID=6549 RepID=UPI002245DA96|nr:dynein heavy chain domain-containing protein 1-like isoform X11 [Mytilus californianus]
MTSKVDLSLEKGTTPSLPALREGQSSLIAPLHGPQSVTPRQKASQWALETRHRINKCMEANEVKKEDVSLLKKDLVAVFITALQQDSRDSWVYLHEVLGIVEPYKVYLEKFDLKTEMYHYIERLIYHADNNKEKLFDLQLADSLSKIFSKEVDKIRQIGAFPARNYCAAPPAPVVKISAGSPKKSMQSPRAYFQLPDGTNPYKTHVTHREDKYMLTKPLTIRDMSRSIADVAAELAARESIWSQHYGTVTQALRTEIPEDDEEKPVKEPVSKASTPRSSLTSLYGKKEKKTPRIEEEKVLVMTGREAVEYFAKLHHIGKIESIHFNIVPHRHYNPYDLISVQKNKVNTEHYVFSTFGVLHVYPDQPSETMSLSDWQREAVLWNAVSKIPFFKNFLVMKMFQKWRYNRNTLDFMRKREKLNNRLLQAVPAFGAALIQVSRLLKELVTVKFLPIEKDKLYLLPEFESEVNYKNMQAEKVIEKFFGYCKMMVDVTAEASFKKLHHCEEQVKKKAVFSKDSLHLQRIKHEQRQVNLIKARNETGRLGNFVKLTDQLIVEHMYEICKTQVIQFVNEVLKNHSETEGFFKVFLVFTKQDMLGLSPSKDKLIKALSSTLKGIPKVLCSNAIPIDGSLPDYHSEETDHTKSEAAEKMERRKSTAAATLASLRRESLTTLTVSSQRRDSVLPTADTSQSQAGETVAGDTIIEEENQVTKSIAGGDDEGIGVPDLPHPDIKSKEEDELGIATPDLVLHDDSTQLVVRGEGFMGQYSPLTKASLEEKLHQDKVYTAAIQFQENMMLEALDEIDQYCKHHSWLSEIHHFCKKWSDKSLKEIKGVPAFQIEQKLNDIRSWSEKVKIFERNFTTENGLFYVDCLAVHDYLIPRLNDIYTEVGMFVAEEATTLANNFCDEMKETIESLKDKSDEINAFATYAKNFNQYKKNSPIFQQRCEYVKLLFEVVRMTYRQLTPEEERDDSNVRARWDEFMLTMQEAAVFVNTKTPLMTHQLEDTHKRLSRAKNLKQKMRALKNPSLYMKLDMEARELAKMATSEHFLDPEQNASKILIEMRRIRDKFYHVQKQLHQASKWREAIVGEPYDLTFLNEITVNIDVLQELWKYIEVSRHAIKDWKQMLFKKMNIKKALEKVIEWQAAAAQLKPYLDRKSSLPEAEKLLSHWFTSLNEFKKDLPILHKLANDALKERHWKAIFVGMNESYDSDKQFTVCDLLTYDLEENDQLIHSIYLGAIAEYDLELKINQISKFWEEREFKLAKHIPDSVLSSKEPELSSNWYTMQNDTVRYAQTPPTEPPKKPSSPRRRTKLEKYRQERAAALVGTPKGMNVAEDDFYKLIEVDELKYQLQDTRISIKGMMQSPYLGDMRHSVEFWNSSLQQVEEITDLWYTCQKKWLYLLKVFERPDLYKKFGGQNSKFENVHKQFKDWMRVVSNDSKVLTVVNRKRGEKGYRLLQGDNLRTLFLSLIQSKEEILKDLETLMGLSRMEFPRLYFISNEELVEVLGISRNPKALQDCAMKVFPGIQDLSYALPSGIASMNTNLDFALNADKLELTGVKGLLEEDVPFFVRVQAHQKATKWLKCLEQNMKNTMTIILQCCVQARMEEGSRQPIHLLEELAKLNKPLTPREHEITTDIKQTFRHWLLRFPVQCVLVSEAILWARSVTKCFEKADIEEMKFLRKNTTSKLDQYVEVLRETYGMKGNVAEDVMKRLSVLLCNLIKQTLHQRDMLDKMIADGTEEENNFEWQASLRYRMDIHTVLRAKTEAVDVEVHPFQVGRKGSRIRKTTLAKPRVEATLEEPPILTRTKTTVSTDYHFSLCYLQQLGNQFSYDYEYQGPIQRLVLTPLTDRAFLSLTQALKYFQCATLIGPASVGKSETVKELMKLFGRNLVTVNCNEDITLPMMTQYMMGMVQSGTGVLFDDTDRLTRGLMSVTAQHFDYIRTALKTLQVCSENQYKIRGQPRFDKKAGIGDKVIRRNSLTTLHPLPTASMKTERQNTVPHGFNEKGLVTYFEDAWVSEKDRRRRHSIEKEIEIKESDLYKNNRPPPLFYEHVKSKNKRSTAPDYSKLLQETEYEQQMLGNIMFNGKLIQASANFSCFMSINTSNPGYVDIPEVFKNLLRPCALIVPDYYIITETTLCCHGFQEYKPLARKITFMLKMLKNQLPRKTQYQFGLKDIKNLAEVATAKLRDEKFIGELREGEVGETPSSDSSRDVDKSLEEHCMVYSLKAVISPSLEDEDDRTVFMNHLRDTFPMCASSRGTSEHVYNHELVKSLKEQFKEDNMVLTKEMIARMLHMNSAIEMRKGIILSGPSGSGKSTATQTLSRAINRLNYLLFAPDHSKDELATDRDLIFHQKKKLKETLDKVGELDEEFLSALSAPEPKQDKTSFRKFKRMTNMLGKVTDAIQDLGIPKTKEVAEYPKVDVVTLNPTALSPQEFLGAFSDGIWQGGLFPKILKDSSFLSDAVRNYISGLKEKKNKGQDLPSVLVRWIVLDGVMHPVWTESINTLFDDENKLSVANGGSVDLQERNGHKQARVWPPLEDTTALIYETNYLSDASPATLARCVIINFGSETVHWNSLFESWRTTAKSRWVLTSAAFKVWEELGRDIFPPTLKFLKNECCSALMTDVGSVADEVNIGIQEITAFLNILSVLLDKMFLRDDFEKKQKSMEHDDDNRKTPSSMAPSRQATSRMTSSSQIEHLLPNYLEILKGMFAFSYIWSFGGHIHERFKDKFSKFSHDAMYRATHPIRIPFPGTVFDYCLDETTGTFLRWGEKQQERSKILAGGYMITPDVEKYNYLIELMLNAQHPVLLTGLPGVGKTTLIQNTVLSKQTSTNILMSRGMTSSIFQNTMVSHILELKHKIANSLPTSGVTAGRGKHTHLFYIDDLNTAPTNVEGGYQPPLELLRQILTQRGCYDRQRKEFQDMEEAMFLASTTPPSVAGYGLGKASHVMSTRLTRLFVNLTVFTPAPETLLSMHGRALQNWLEEFPTYSVEHHFEFARAMTLGLLDLYGRIKEKLRPTPSNAHYLFSLHDVARVVHGILLMSPRSRSRKMLRKKKDGDSRSSRVSRQTSWSDSKSRTVSGASGGYVIEGGSSAPMMKVIGQLWCHECTRMFADRLVSPDDSNWFTKTLEETALKYFCLPRDDHKSEMAAISEETHSQTGRGTPQTTTSPPISEPESEEEDNELTAVDEVSTTRENDDQTTTSSEKLVTPMDTPIPLGESTHRAESTPGPRGTPDTGRTRASGVDTELGTNRTTNADPTSESEYDSEPSEESESSEDESMTETETETVDTARESSGTDSVEHEQMGLAKTKVAPPTDQTAPGAPLTSRVGNIGSQINLKQVRSSQGSLKFTKSVTFKAGLLADWEHEAYFGPLMSMDELKGSSTSLVDFIFSKFYMTTHTETLGMAIEKAYMDGTEESLAEALSTCLNVYNAGTSQRLDLVFFSEAIRHAARLSRVLAIQGGHAVLLGMSYSTGRCTLARLAAYIAHCKKAPSDCCRKRCKGLFEPKSQSDPSKNLLIVREHIKRACYHSGILGKPSVLLVHEDLGSECLQDICSVMADGTSPGLYTDDEIQSIVSHMMPGGVQTKRVDKIEQAFERFLKKVRHNLHVIVCLSSKGNSFSSNFNNLHSKLSEYPGLVKHAVSVDLYKPWTFEAYVKIAEVWLRDQRTKVPIPWHPTRMLDQISLTAHAMAYMHLSSKAVIERQFCHQREPLRFYSPLTFMEFVHLFRLIAAHIVKMEIENIGKHEQALGKVNEAFGSINEYKREVSELTPKYKSATDEIKDLVARVEDQKEQYIAALDRCKDQEQKIEALQGPLEQLRKEAQTDFDRSFFKRSPSSETVEYFTATQYRVNPNYQAALTALNVINRNDLEEVKSFREPPELVKFVVKALCLLFKVPQDWENAKLLLIRDNFMDEMMFFDKDHIPDDIFEELKTFVFNPLFDPDLVKQVSLSATNVCIWVHAVYKYAHIHRNMQPRLRNLLEHEDKFTQAQAKLGQLRVEANRIKSALERVITSHKAAVKRAKTIERHMQAIERKIARAVNLMEHMSMQHYLWKSELRKARRNVLTSPGDALITAACVCYHGPLEDKWRAELLHDWQDRSKHGNYKMTKKLGEDVFPLSSNLEGLFDGHKEFDTTSSMSRTVTESSVDSESTLDMPSLPEIKTYKYPPAVYDTSKYYKSELKKQESFEYDQTQTIEFEDSDDEDEQSTLMNRNNFTLQEILSDFDELSNWRLSNLPTDLHSIQNALLMRVSCHNRKHCWPMLIDPDNQAELWVKTVQNSKNVFTEKDVQESTPDELDGIPLESNRSKSSSGQLPPSRGTTLTYSDVYTDDRTASTNTLTTTDYTKREDSVRVHFQSDESTMGRHSRNTWNSEELRPVTSVTNSWENFSLHTEQNLDRPASNLWIIEADDPSLDSKLINAIVHGITILITHIERKSLDPVFRGLLLKHFFVDKEGNKIIKVGTYEFRYHPDFKLYLSTSVPLFLKGDGLHSIPIHRMCVINMALSDEAIMNHLLSETMKVEKKEFEGQKRSNENDIILHRQRLAKEHELIREKTLNLDGPLLEDQTMLNSLLACHEEIHKNKQILEETRFMGDHLEEKFAHYRIMITHITVLYNMIKKMCVLHPYYYLPFSTFVEIFSCVMTSRDRGKGSVGAPQARAQELADASSAAIFKYVSMMMFEQHYQLLQLLVSMERLRMSGKATTKELSLFINNFDKQGIDELSLMDSKPVWMAGQIWIDCLVLEQLHHCYHGLRKSLVQNSIQWQEYFQHPIAIMNPVPGMTMQELSVFQKCILWKICAPQRLCELASAMTLYEMGSIRSLPDNYNIRDVYAYTNNTTPVVFMMPNTEHHKGSSSATKGYSYVSPTHEVKRLAKEIGMEGKVRVMNFGVPGQMCEVRHALEDCIQNGYWLLLQNYHLAEEPEQEFYILLKDIVYSKWIKQERKRQKTDISDDGNSLVTFSKTGDEDNELHIHNTFRLWITTQADSGRLIPGVLVQYGIKVTCEKTGNFKSTIQKSYRSVAFLLQNWKHINDSVSGKQDKIMPLALLHSLLLQQSFYGRNAFINDHHWTLSDLAMAVDVFKKVVSKSTSTEKIMDMVARAYSDHCTDSTDAKVVQSLVSILVQYATGKQVPEKKSNDIIGLLNTLLMESPENFTLKKAVDSLEELTAKNYGLPETADKDVMYTHSRVLIKDMIQVIGAPELLLRVNTAISYREVSVDSILPSLISTLQKCAVLPETNKNQMYPIDVFIHYEVEGYKTLIQTVQSDLSLLQRRSKGEILTPPHYDDVIHSMNRDRVPQLWLAQTFPSGSSLTKWIKELPVKIQIISSLVNDPSPVAYNLSMFLRPDRFIEAIKQTFARKHFVDINSVEFELQVMPTGIKPSVPPKDGVYITGLRLHNALWDSTRAILMENDSENQQPHLMPYIWLKPVDVSSPSKFTRKYELYDCPVYCSDDPRSHGDKYLVTNLPLPTFDPPCFWCQHRVFLSSSLSSNQK